MTNTRHRGRRPRYTASELDLHDYARSLQRGGRVGRSRIDRWTPPVLTDWPDPLLVTEAELDAWEAYFADVLGELFGPVEC